MTKQKPITTKPNTAAEWKGKGNKTFLLPLPSGITIECKPLRILDCITTGYIPLELFQKVLATSDKFGKSSSMWEGIEQDDFTIFMDVVRKVAVSSVVSPKVIATDIECGEDEIYVRDIPDEDLIAIFGAVMANQSLVAEPFRK